MGNFENQKYLSEFIVQNSTALAQISIDNPALYNALGNAFDFLSERFGTGDTKMPKKRIPKTQPKKKAAKNVTVTVNAEDLVVRGQHFRAKEDFKTVYEITAVDRYANEISLSWNDNGVITMKWAYDTAVKLFGNGKWIPTLADGTPLNVAVTASTMEVETPTEVMTPAEVKEEEEVQPMAPPTGSTSTVNVTINTDTPRKISITEDNFLKVGDKIYLKEYMGGTVFTVSDNDGNEVELDFVDANEDIQTNSYTISRIKKELNEKWFLLDANELPLEVTLLKASTKKPKKGNADKIAELQLELDTQQLLAEIGDTDAIEEVKKITAKIEALQKK